MIEIIKKPWDYSLFKNNDDYILSVVCGNVAIFQINIQLDNDEKQKYLIDGSIYIDELAKKIQYGPGSYTKRNIDNLIA